MLSLQLIASNTEGKSSPSEVLVCTTNPDKPGPPSTPCVTAATPYGFTVTWGKDITAPESNSRGRAKRFKLQVELGLRTKVRSKAESPSPAAFRLVFQH